MLLLLPVHGIEGDLHLARAIHPLSGIAAIFSDTLTNLFSQAVDALRPLSLHHYHHKLLFPQHTQSQFNLYHHLRYPPQPTPSRTLSTQSSTSHAFNTLDEDTQQIPNLLCANGGRPSQNEPERCACPFDFGGDTCEGRRQFTCSLELISTAGAAPQPCQTLDGSNLCRYVSLDADALSVSLTFSMQCRLFYLTLQELSNNDPEALQMPYIVLNQSQNLAISQPANLGVRLKVYDFNRIYDDSMTFYAYKSAADILNQGNITIDLEPALLSDRFALGSTVYIEIIASSQDLPLLFTPPYSTSFQVVQTIRNSSKTSCWETFLISVFSVFL